MPLSSRGIFFWFAVVRGRRRFDPPQAWCYGSPMRRAAMLVAMAWALGAVGCGGKQVPQHTGYKGKKPTPWTKAKPIELDEELKAKVSGELDYGDVQARQVVLSFTPPGPGSVDARLRVRARAPTPTSTSRSRCSTPTTRCSSAPTPRAEDTTEQKKQRKLRGPEDGTGTSSTSTSQGRLDAADFDHQARSTRAATAEVEVGLPQPGAVPRRAGRGAAVRRHAGVGAAAQVRRAGQAQVPQALRHPGRAAVPPAAAAPGHLRRAGQAGRARCRRWLAVDHQRRSRSVRRAHHGRRGHRRRRRTTA
jgi:hypothetical protein